MISPSEKGQKRGMWVSDFEGREENQDEIFLTLKPDGDGLSLIVSVRERN